MIPEWLALVALLLIGLAPLRILSRGARSLRESWGIVLCGVGAAILALGLLLAARPIAHPSAPPADIPLEIHKDGYVSSGTCRACHPRQYDTWRGSFHRSMTRVAAPETVRGDFSRQTVTAQGLLYRLERRGDEFWVETDEFWKPAPSDRPPNRVWRRIRMVTGSHHMQVYWFASGEGRKLEQLPIIYLFEARRWIPREAAFLMPPAEGVRVESGRWNDTCINCHATHGQPRLLENGRIDSEAAELGIACEACHGPAKPHVVDNHDPWRRYERHLDGGAQPTITQPARLDAALSSQVCGQCHSISILPGERFAAWEIDGSPYRPGQDLELTFAQIRYSRPESTQYLKEHMPGFLENRFWSDGTVRVSGREYNGLIESPCFVKGRGSRQMSCLSCHTMHQAEEDHRPRAAWTDDQLAPGRDGDEACLQCHAQQIRDVAAHTHHAAASSGSRCYNCHMSYTTYGLLKAIRSHRIDSPTVQSSLATGRPNACNQCHLDRTLDWAAGYLHEWYGTELPALSPEQRSVAAGPLWALTGDAGQRALVAWSMGWEPSRQASGNAWQAVYLAPLLDDPYDAVRYIAQRSLKSLPGFERFEYDFMAQDSLRQEDVRRALMWWRSLPRPGRPEAMLSGSDIERLLARRDDRPIDLKE